MDNKAEQQADFFDRVYAIVDQIPVGRVTTYGHIARTLGAARSARMVGWALHTCAGTPLPAHRVVNRVGALSGALHFGGPHVMEDLLRSEGVTFLPDGRVDLSQHLWVPSEDPLSTE